MKVSSKRWLSLSILFTVFLIGCVVQNIPKDYSLDDTKEKGVLIVSLTRSAETEFNMFVHLGGMDNAYKVEVPLKDPFTSLDWSSSIAEDKPCGRLAIIELPQGEYEFYSWHGSAGNQSVRPNERFSKRFKVIAGKAVYIGNIHFSFKKFKKKSKKGLLGLLSGHYLLFDMKIADMRERDLSLLYQKNPMITEDKVVSNVLQ